MAQFSLVTGFFEGTRENTLHIFQAKLVTQLMIQHLFFLKIKEILKKTFTFPKRLVGRRNSTSKSYHIGYGNTGCGVFKRGGTKLERFLHKNQHT